MNINDFNIGIEIEYTEGSTREVADNIQFHNIPCELVPYGRCHSTHSGWIVTTDQTVSRNICYGTGEAYGGEVVSPKLKYADALEQVETVCTAINQIDDVAVNRNCGLHISVSWPEMTADQVRNLLARYKEYERDIDAFMPPSRRGSRNRWCGSLDASWVNRVVNGREQRLSQLSVGGKFFKINLSNLGTGERSRIEFRHHSGTTDGRKIQNWIKFICRFIMSAQMQANIQQTYRSTKRGWFADIREQLEAVGIKTKWSRALAQDGANGLTFHAPNGAQIVGLTYQEVSDFYEFGANNKGRNARLKQEFIEFATTLMNETGATPEADTGLYHGLSEDVVRYFTARTAHFNSN